MCKVWGKFLPLISMGITITLRAIDKQLIRCQVTDLH